MVEKFVKENDKLVIHGLLEIKDFKVHGGNTGCLSSLTLFWTGRGIEFNASG